MKLCCACSQSLRIKAYIRKRGILQFCCQLCKQSAKYWTWLTIFKPCSHKSKLGVLFTINLNLATPCMIQKISWNEQMVIGHILDLYCILPSNASHLCKNYTKLHFDAKHLEKGLNGGWNFWGPFFIKSPISSQYWMLP